MRFHPRVLTAQQKRTLLALAPWTTSHGFYLAGGTALALYLGHRESVDLDWFRNDPIADPGSLVADVQKLVKHPLVVSSSSKGTVVGQIEGVKVSFFHLPFRLLGPLQEWSGSRLASFQDLAAMKLLAAAQRGTRRDFIDLHALLRTYAPLPKLIEHFVAKYPDGSVPHLLRSLTYFKDADGEPSPQMITRTSWEQVKRDITAAVTALDAR